MTQVIMWDQTSDLPLLAQNVTNRATGSLKKKVEITETKSKDETRV